MYNLLMKSSRDYNEWEENQGRLYDVSRLVERIFEFTAETIKEQFTANGGIDCDALIKLPCLFTYETYELFNTVGSIGWITAVRPEGRKYRIIYTLPNVYPKIPINGDFVEALGIERSGEQYRTHWAVKDADLFEVTTRLLHKAGNGSAVLSGEEMNRVWGDGHRRKKLAFLSHRAAYGRQVAQVREQLEEQGLSCFLAHQDVSPSWEWQDEILNALKTMDVFIGFVTGDFHDGGWPDQEVGYAYQRGVPRLFVKLEDEDPVGMVAREQALVTSWERAGQEIIAHLKQAGILQ